MIASAVRVINDGNAPLPVNIAGQSLPDRPYLRNNQTFAGRFDTSGNANITPSTTNAFGLSLVNPAGSGVNMIDPRILCQRSTNIAMQASVFTVVNAAGIDLSTAEVASNKNTGVAIKGAIQALMSNTNVGNDTAVGSSFVALWHMDSDPEFNIPYKGAHGGLLVTPGTAVRMDIFSCADDVTWSCEWIEQPIA